MMSYNLICEYRLPAPGVEGNMYQTQSFDHADMNDYLIDWRGDLYLRRHSKVEVRDSLEASGMLWQYKSYRDLPIKYGHMKDFNGEVILYGHNLGHEFKVMIENGSVKSVEAVYPRSEDQPSPCAD